MMKRVHPWFALALLPAFLMLAIGCQQGDAASTTLDAAVAVATTTTAVATSNVPSTLLRDARSGVVQHPRPAVTASPNFAHFAAQSTFVYKPGGTSGGIVYTTWPDVGLAIKQSPPPRFLYLDDSLADAHVTTGEWDVEATTFKCNFNANAFLTFDSGAHFHFTEIWIDSGITFQEAANAVDPAYTLGPNAFGLIVVTGQVNVFNIGALGAQPWGHIETGSFLSLMLANNTGIGDGTHHAFAVDQGGGIVLNTSGSSGPAAHALVGDGGVTLAYGDSLPNLTQDVATLTKSYYGFANIFGQTTTTGAGTASPLTFTPSVHNITFEKTTLIRVSANFSGTASAAGLVTMAVKRDSTTIANGTFQVKTNGDSFDIAVNTIDSLPDASQHSYSYTLTNGAGGTFTGTASGTSLWGNEL
jgi:hypothetical protein